MQAQELPPVATPGSSCFFGSPGAAGELADILVESLRSELQPLHRRKVGKDRFRQIVDREAAPDGDGRSLDAVGALRREDVCSEKLSGSAIGNQLDQPPRIPCRKSAWNVVERDDGRPDLEPGGAGLSFGEPDAANLRV
jgi:hypothetical protein